MIAIVWDALAAQTGFVVVALFASASVDASAIFADELVGASDGAAWIVAAFAIFADATLWAGDVLARIGEALALVADLARVAGDGLAGIFEASAIFTDFVDGASDGATRFDADAIFAILRGLAGERSAGIADADAIFADLVLGATEGVAIGGSAFSLPTGEACGAFERIADIDALAKGAELSGLASDLIAGGFGDAEIVFADLAAWAFAISAIAWA